MATNSGNTPPDDDDMSVLDALASAEALLAPPKPAKLLQAERRQRVFDLRMAGKTLHDIAAELGVNYTTVQKDFAAVTTSIDTTKWLRSRIDGDVHYLDKLISVLSPRALVGDVDAIETILKIMARQHKILGMEAPKRIDIRYLVQQWAEREGLDPDDVIDVTATLLSESS